jgi:Family of unknown function (DUF5675)
MITVIELIRTYRENVKVGHIVINDIVLCQSIELPWHHNRPNQSCIPEGRYNLEWRLSERFGMHLHVLAVPNRKYILIHPANDALRELRGCIAPVMQVHGHLGQHSRMATNLLVNNVKRIGIHSCQLKISSL